MGRKFGVSSVSLETAQGSRKTEAAAQQPDTESTDSYDSSSSS